VAEEKSGASRGNELRPLVGLEEWLEMNKNPPSSYIEQILPSEPGEFMLVAGRTGIGKSILVMHMAFCLANGVPFFGFKCKKVRVGLLVMEGGTENIRDRMNKIIPQYTSTANIGFNLRPPFLLERHTKDFMETFEGYKVVILDNLRQVTPGQYLEPKYAATFLKIYQACLGRIGAVGIITCHIKKPNPASVIAPGDIYVMKGATEYVDACTTGLVLERKRQGHDESGRKTVVDYKRLELHFAKARIATKDLQPLELYQNYEKCSFDLIKEKSYDMVLPRK